MAWQNIIQRYHLVVRFRTYNATNYQQQRAVSHLRKLIGKPVMNSSIFN